MRFNVLLRLFGNLTFIILQLGRMGIVLYLPAIALSAATGINVYFCILSMGVLCTVYTVLGGIEAVIWTDVLQVIVFYTGAFIILAIAIFSLDGGITQFFEICSTNNNFNWVNKGWDVRTTSLFVMIVVSFQPILMFLDVLESWNIPLLIFSRIESFLQIREGCRRHTRDPLYQ